MPKIVRIQRTISKTTINMDSGNARYAIHSIGWEKKPNPFWLKIFANSSKYSCSLYENPKGSLALIKPETIKSKI